MKKTLVLLAFVLAVILVAVAALPQSLSKITPAQLAFGPLQPTSTRRPIPTHDPNLVYIRLYSPAGFDLKLNVGYVLQIGDQRFDNRACKEPTLLDKTIEFCLTQSEFAGLTDGAPIEFLYKYGDGLLPGHCFGPLNKAQLQMTEEYPRCLERSLPYLTQAKSLLTDTGQIAQFDVAIEQVSGLLDTRFWLDATHLNPDYAEEFFAEARTALTTLSGLPNVPLDLDANREISSVTSNIVSILYVMEGLAGATMDEGLPPGANDFSDLDERAMNLLAKIDKGQKAVQNKDYLKAFDYYVSARQDALTGSAVDDAPTYPTTTTQNSPLNTDLLYYINSAGDEDTFIFTTTVADDVEISLTNLPANYDLFVYSAITNGLVGSSTQVDTASEIVSIANATPGDYYVQVVPVNNAWDSNNPYTLRFDAPGEPTPTPTNTPTPLPTETPTATAAATLALYLHGSGGTANPPTLFLDSTAPTGTTAKYRDSASVNFSGGNAWQEIGTWQATPTLTAGQLTSLSDLHVWLGLKNSDDIGTRFDLRAEVYKGGALVTSGESDCITNVTRNADQAKEVVITFATFTPVNFDGSAEALSLKILVRVGTDGAGALCGGHSNAVGVRLYFDAVSRAAMFGAP